MTTLDTILSPDDVKIVEDVKRAFPYFRIEDERVDYVAQGNQILSPTQYAVMQGKDSLDFYAEQVNIHASAEDLKTLRACYADFDKQNWERVNAAHPEYDKTGYWKEYEVDGCPEEPDAPKVKVLVRHLGDPSKKVAYPVVMPIAVGGLFTSDPWTLANAPIAKYLRAQLVIPVVRTDAVYPAAINDLHAVYQWMANNADELGFDMDGVIIEGVGSGGHLAAALPFRLKKYNWCGAPMPRGVVSFDGYYDDRETTRSMRIINKGWSGVVNRAANMRYMGVNFASGFVGPDAYANHASVEECVGLPPYAIYATKDYPGCDPAIEFMEKMTAAGNYVHFYMDADNEMPDAAEQSARIGGFVTEANADYKKPTLGVDTLSRMEAMFIGCIKEFLDFDVRRTYE